MAITASGEWSGGEPVFGFPLLSWTGTASDAVNSGSKLADAQEARENEAREHGVTAARRADSTPTYTKRRLTNGHPALHPKLHLVDGRYLWQPSGSGEFRALRPGDLFLFNLKAPWNAIAGGGVFAHASLAPLSLAWEAFGQKNGNPDLGSMRRTIAQLRRAAPLGEREDPVIGCRILTSPFFWPEELWLPAPASFAANTVTGKGYSTEEADGLALWEAVRGRLALASGPAAERSAVPHGPGLSDPAVPFVLDPAGPRCGAPTPLQRRLGQGAFRLAVTDGYGRRCAVSGERTLPILDAAHVRPYAEGGVHEVSNGLLLRTDIHRLFDLGYVTITEKGRFAVSARLKADFDNGAHCYAMQGHELRAPERGFAPPAPEALKWHRENIYLEHFEVARIRLV